MCREDLQFTDVFIGFAGRVHDARVFQHSPLFDKGSQLCNGNHLLGDSAYPNIDWLLTPFKQNLNLTPKMRQYNKVHSSLRIQVEIAIGMLKGRYRRLKFLESLSIENICGVVLSACILHNICILNEDTAEILETNNAIPVAYLQHQVLAPVMRDRGTAKRIRIMNQLP